MGKFPPSWRGQEQGLHNMIPEEGSTSSRTQGGRTALSMLHMLNELLSWYYFSLLPLSCYYSFVVVIVIYWRQQSLEEGTTLF